MKIVPDLFKAASGNAVRKRLLTPFISIVHKDLGNKFMKIVPDLFKAASGNAER